MSFGWRAACTTISVVLVGSPTAAEEMCRAPATMMAKVELYLGATGGPPKWRRFLAEVVTPRFPDGLTVLEATGQWRGPNGPTHEATHVLVIFYRPDATSDARIDAIRAAYRRRFAQRSVLRADSGACVSF